MTDPVMWTIQMPETGDPELDTLGLLHRVMSLRMESVARMPHEPGDIDRSRERIAKYFYERWGPQ